MRAVGCSSSVSDAQIGPGIRAESLRPSAGVQTRLCHAHTQPLVTSPVLSMSCPKNWALEDRRFLRSQKVPSKKSMSGGCQGKPPSTPPHLGDRMVLVSCFLS